MGILYMLFDSKHLKISGERADNEFLKPETITLHINHPIILSELIQWEKMNEMYNRVIKRKEGTSEDVYNALVQRMEELKEGVALESQRSMVTLNLNNMKQKHP